MCGLNSIFIIEMLFVNIIYLQGKLNYVLKIIWCYEIYSVMYYKKLLSFPLLTFCHSRVLLVLSQNCHSFGSCGNPISKKTSQNKNSNRHFINIYNLRSCWSSEKFHKPFHSKDIFANLFGDQQQCRLVEIV